MTRVSSMYIRTKNNIYEVENILRDNGFVKGYNVGEMAFITKDKVINQSENLLELIDEFVVIRDSTKTNQLVRTDNIEYLKEMMKEDKRIVEVKGAVWTDFGLKYVAILTEDGGVELICI